MTYIIMQSAAEVNQQLSTQRINNLFDATYTLAIGQPIIGLICINLLSASVDGFIVGWFSVLLLHSVLFVIAQRQYRKTAVKPQHGDLWLRRLIMLTAILGLIYATAWTILIPTAQSHTDLVVLSIWMTILAALVCNTLYADRIVMLVFVVFCVGVGITLLIHNAGTFGMWLSALLLVFTALTLRTGHVLRLAFNTSAGEHLLLQQERAQRTALEQKLAQLSFNDSLTGLANKQAFTQHFTDELNRAERAGNPVSLLIIDIDAFGLFNKQYGHVAGDSSIQRIAEILSNSSRRAGEMAARLEGATFGVILPSVTAPHAFVVAEAIRTAVQALRIDHASNLATGANVVTVSIGVITAVPNKDKHAEYFTQHADAALKKAKSSGRNGIHQVTEC
ncbi:GGDEF domain-containing protein [Aestuariibacter salexigens]|uniref:GGDEF domain-containing protein n=1 Tax=Aestuariibacter salexigens TaxID=226010 RepID=UPI00041BD946|nr:GGDEF domain-containing protein [Aestuariibacter salexigens]